MFSVSFWSRMVIVDEHENVLKSCQTCERVRVLLLLSLMHLISISPNAYDDVTLSTVSAVSPVSYY
jgi:hypothetical protein